MEGFEGQDETTTIACALLSALQRTIERAHPGANAANELVTERCLVTKKIFSRFLSLS